MNYVAINHHRKLTWSLGIAGLIPFVFACVSALTNTRLFGIAASTLFVTYSVLICSFLAGTLWGVIINEVKSKKLLLLSNVILLLAWTCLLVPRLDVAIIVLALIYPLLYLVESRMMLEHTPEYICMRRFLTVVVVVLHGLFFVAIYN